MSRAIKFRAWNKLAQKMAVIDALDFVLDSYRAHAGTFSGSGHLADIELMQFTGLLDKTGKEIYEGDIVQCDRWPMSDDIALVAWGQLGWQPFLHLIERDEHLADLYEIIGNIYENPELVAKERK